jgi:hypothetical protein
VWELDAIGTPSKLRFTHKTETLARMFPHLDFSIDENTARRKWKNPRSWCADWTPEAEKNRSVSRWGCKNKSLINSLCNLPVVPAIVDIIRCIIIIVRAIFTDLVISSFIQW